MVKRVVILLLAACLLLGGCSAMLNRPYEVVTEHAYHAAAGASGIPDVSTYQALVNSIYSLVQDGVEQGQIRLSSYTSKTGDVAGDLNTACNEVANEDPLGAYAVDFIRSDYTRVVKDYQVTITISYRRTPEQIKALVNVTGSSAIREELRQVLREFRGEAALRVGYFSEDQDYIAALIRQAYYNTPEAALGMPEWTITLYPEEAASGPRVVEILLTYPQEVQSLRTQSQGLLDRADSLLAGHYGLTGSEGGRQLFSLLTGAVQYRSDGGSTAYDALIQGAADSEGMALAYLLLAQRAGLEAQLVQGTLAGEPHMWNMLRIGTGRWRHLDPARTDGSVLLDTDEELAALGYDWDREEYPACVA